MIKDWLLHNWRSKLVSLSISAAIWYLINSNIETEEPPIPVPGTGNGSLVPVRPSNPALEDTILGPITPPVPGSGKSN